MLHRKVVTSNQLPWFFNKKIVLLVKWESFARNVLKFSNLYEIVRNLKIGRPISSLSRVKQPEILVLDLVIIESFLINITLKINYSTKACDIILASHITTRDWTMILIPVDFSKGLALPETPVKNPIGQVVFVHEHFSKHKLESLVIWLFLKLEIISIRKHGNQILCFFIEEVLCRWLSFELSNLLHLLRKGLIKFHPGHPGVNQIVKDVDHRNDIISPAER